MPNEEDLKEIEENRVRGEKKERNEAGFKSQKETRSMQRRNKQKEDEDEDEEKERKEKGRQEEEKEKEESEEKSEEEESKAEKSEEEEEEGEERQVREPEKERQKENNDITGVASKRMKLAGEKPRAERVVNLPEEQATMEKCSKGEETTSLPRTAQIPRKKRKAPIITKPK